LQLGGRWGPMGPHLPRGQVKGLDEHPTRLPQCNGGKGKEPQSAQNPPKLLTPCLGVAQAGRGLVRGLGARR
jgi:hypothetical protein